MVWNRAEYQVMLAFSAKASQYSGQRDEDIEDYINRYVAVCQYLYLSDFDQIKLLHYLFRDKALRYYNDPVWRP